MLNLGVEAEEVRICLGLRGGCLGGYAIRQLLLGRIFWGARLHRIVEGGFGSFWFYEMQGSSR